MIKIFQFPASIGLPNASPFCLKLETWLRMAELEYEVVVTPDPRKAPMGKLPIIEHDGKKIADSSCAIAYLEKACGVNLNAQLNPSERATAHALQRMLEEHTYWALLHFRWLNEENWAKTKDVFFGKMPAVLKAFVPNAMRKKILRDAQGQGLHLHSEEEITRRFAEDMRALADNLGEKPYFGGYQAANIDACAYGFLAQILHSTLPNALTEITQTHSNLVSFTERMRDRYYADPS